MKNIIWFLFIVIVGLCLSWGIDHASSRVEVGQPKSVHTDIQGPQRILV